VDLKKELRKGQKITNKLQELKDWLASKGLTEASRDFYVARYLPDFERSHDSPAKILASLNLANGKDSKQRSERREACIQLLGCLIHFLDLLTLRVGIPKEDGTLRGLTVPYLARLSAARRLKCLTNALAQPYFSCRRKRRLFFLLLRRFLMKRKTLYNSILTLFGIVYLFSFPGFSAEPPQSERGKQIIPPVENAAALVK
jgi:hypothetical protein